MSRSGPEPASSRPLDWSRLEPRIAAFERAVRHGEAARIEDYLDGLTPHERAAMLPELVLAELELVRESGRTVFARAYLDRFPELATRADVIDQLDETERNPVAAIPPPPACDGPSAETLPPVRRVGRYVIHEKLGQGGFGTVYRASDPVLDRSVALKVFHDGQLVGRPDGSDLLSEARSAARLAHPGIVAVHDVGECDGRPYLVREFVPGGETLGSYRPAREEVRTAAALVRTVAESLGYAHSRGVVHGDVKPSNILVDPEGNPRLTDFGQVSGAKGKTRQVGTPSYMAPEQLRGAGKSAAVDGRSDVYSLGAVLYELLTGEPPFIGSERMIVLQRLEYDPRPPRQLRESVPRDLENVCLKALAREPGRRYPTAAEFADDLGRFLDGRPVRARRAGSLTHITRAVARHPRIAAVIVLTFVLTTSLWVRAEAYRRIAEKRLVVVHQQRRMAIENLRQAHWTLAAMIRLGDPSTVAGSRKTTPEAYKALLREPIARSRQFLFVEGFGRDPALQVERSMAAGLIASVVEQAEPPAAAADAWKEAVDLTEPLVDARPDDVGHRLRLTNAYVGRGKALQALGKLDEAEHALRRACAVGGFAVARPSGSDPAGLFAAPLASAHYAMGDLLRARGQPHESAASFRRAIVFIEDVLRLSPDLPTWHVNIAAAWHELSVSLRRCGRAAAAETATACAAARAFWTELERDPRVDPREVRLGLGQCAFQEGALAYDEGRFSVALEAFRDAARRFAPEARGPGKDGDPAWQTAHAASLHNVGRALVGLGRPAEALPLYEQAARIRQELTEHTPLDASHWSNWSGTLYRMAVALHTLGRDEEAAEAARSAVEHQKRATELDPNRESYRKLLEEERTLASQLRLVRSNPDRPEEN